LRDIGVDRIQGYYMSKPLPEDELLSWAEYYVTNLKLNN
jgi:EAL domain-containing protein (putative c-di-GMP-specific phosphodiesterase class I)